MRKYVLLVMLCASCAPTTTHPSCATKEDLASPPVQANPEVSEVEPTPEDSRIATELGRRVAEAVGQGFAAAKPATVPIINDFWQRDFREYELHSTIQGLIDQIDNVEMLAFLKRRGVELSPESILTSNSLIAYLQYRNLGTQAAYAWLDLTKGDPDFIRAVLDWQAIRKERGFEFTPTHYLLFQATLVTKGDAEVWADLFKATFTTLGEQDHDRKVLMLVCLLNRWRDLKEVDPPLVERMAFLAEELKYEALAPSYRQLLHLALYQATFLAKDFVEAATWARDIEPPTAGLALTFTAQILAKDLEGAAATVAQIAASKPENPGSLAWYRNVILAAKAAERRRDSKEPPKGIPSSQ